MQIYVQDNIDTWCIASEVISCVNYLFYSLCNREMSLGKLAAETACTRDGPHPNSRGAKIRD